MNQRAALLVEKLGHFRIAVAQRVDCDAGGEVEVLSVFNVIEVTSFTLLEHWRRPNVGGHHVLQLGIYKAGGLRVRWRVGSGKRGFSLQQVIGISI